MIIKFQVIYRGSVSNNLTYNNGIVFWCICSFPGTNLLLLTRNVSIKKQKRPLLYNPWYTVNIIFSRNKSNLPLHYASRCKQAFEWSTTATMSEWFWWKGNVFLNTRYNLFGLKGWSFLLRPKKGKNIFIRKFLVNYEDIIHCMLNLYSVNLNI